MDQTLFLSRDLAGEKICFQTHLGCCRINFLAPVTLRASVSCRLLARGHSQFSRLYPVSCNMAVSISSSQYGHLLLPGLQESKNLRCGFTNTEYSGNIIFCDEDHTCFSKLQQLLFSNYKKLVIIKHLNYTQKQKEDKNYPKSKHPKTTYYSNSVESLLVVLSQCIHTCLYCSSCDVCVPVTCSAGWPYVLKSASLATSNLLSSCISPVLKDIHLYGGKYKEHTQEDENTKEVKIKYKNHTHYPDTTVNISVCFLPLLPSFTQSYV